MGVGWSTREWREAVSSPDWGPRVLEALRRHFAEGKPLLEPARLITASLEVDPDGTPVLLAIYEHPYWPERTGLRRRLDHAYGLGHGSSPEEALAEEIAFYEISEPLGRQYDLLVEDENGVWWWGDGYPPITDHPDLQRSKRPGR